MRHYGMGRGKWVFVDWMGIEPGYGTAWGGVLSDGYCMPEGVRIAVHRPVMDFDAPILEATPGMAHETCGIGNAMFMKDQGRFRCWYTAVSPNDHPRWKVLMRLCYAESDDGVAWRKPILNLREFNGSTQNNLVPGPEGHVFIDPSAPDEQRYKMVAPGGRAGVLGAYSADGYRFTQLPQAVLPGNNSDTDNTAWFNPKTGRYAVYTRQTDGVMQRRGINRSETSDFTSFPPSTPVVESSPNDPPDWDTYFNGFTPWPGAEDAYVMMMSIYRHYTDDVEVHLGTSRDELIWHRPLGREPWATGAGLPTRLGSFYSCGGVLQTAPKEWSVYFHVHPFGHNEVVPKLDEYCGWLIRGRLREDGFTSLTADGHGQFWTVPFKLESDEIRLNYRSLYSGYVKCEVIETAIVGGTGHSVSIGEPANGFGMADCDPMIGDSADQAITWRGNSSLAALRGKEVRLRLSMFKSDLYAMKF